MDSTKQKVEVKEVAAVIVEALNRYKAGRRKYGSLDPATDKRDFLHEAEQELLDCINYCVFQILKLRRVKNRAC